MKIMQKHNDSRKLGINTSLKKYYIVYLIIIYQYEHFKNIIYIYKYISVKINFCKALKIFFLR